MEHQTTLTQPPTSRFGVFENRNFLYLWLGQSISTFGDRFTEIAVPILIYQLTGSALQLGLAFIAQVVPSLLFGLFAGALSDRWDRRRTLIFTDLIRFAIILAIPAVTLLSVPLAVKLVSLYVLIFLATSVRQFFLPAKISLIPDIVPEKQLMSANSVDQSSMKVMDFLGYGAAGALIQLAGPFIAFIIDAFTFLVSAALIFPMRVRKIEVPPPLDKTPSVVEDIRAGLRVISRKASLRGTVALSFLAPLALGATAPLTIVYADRALGVGAAGFAMIEATIALGLAIGVVLVGKLARNIPRTSLLSLGVTGMGASFLAAYGLPILWFGQPDLIAPGLRLGMVLPFFFLSAAANGAIFLGLRTIVQEQSPRGMIGRVFSVITVASSVASAVGASTAGLAERFDVRYVLIFWSVIVILIGLAASRWKAFQIAEGERSL